MTTKFYIEHVRNVIPAWEIETKSQQITIGRDNECDVVIPDPDKHLSRKHINITYKDNACILEVLSKVNPVYLAGNELGYLQKVQLNNQDTISVIDFKLTVQLNSDLLQKKAESIEEDDPFAWLNDNKLIQNDPLANFSTTSKSEKSIEADPFEGLFEFSHSNQADEALINNKHTKSTLETSTPLDPLELLSRKNVAPKVSENRNLDSLVSKNNNKMKSEPLVRMTPERPDGTPSLEHVHPYEQPFQNNHQLGSALRATSKSNPKNDELLKVFLNEIGISELDVNDSKGLEIARLAGKLTKASTDGIMRLLTARSQMKKELGTADRTIISAKNNNPLKLMATTEEALKFFFNQEGNYSSAFMPPLQAVEDAYQDVLAHEFALVAGMRAAVIGALNIFDPERIEDSIEKNGMVGGLLTNKKARLWDAFESLYRELQLSNADNIDELFEKDFLEAYHAQLKKFKTTKK